MLPVGSARFTRRGFLKSAGLVFAVGAAGPLIAACQPQVVEKVVEKPVEVTKIVEKEKLVDKPVEVTKIVEKEKVVEKTVQQTVVVERVVTPTPAPTPATKPGEPTPSTSRPGTLALWSMAFPPHQDMMGTAISMFNKKFPNQAVDYQPQPGNYGAKWRAALAAAQAPDMFVIHGTALLELAIAKQLAPVTPDVLSLAEAKRDFMPENSLQGFYKGNLYALGVPDPPGDAGLVVNMDDLQEAGLKHVVAFENVAQMLEYGRKLVKKERDAVVKAGLMFTGDGNNPIYWLSYICDLAIKWFDNDKQQFTLKTPEAEQTLQFFYDIIWKERLDDPALGNNSSNALGQGLAALAFKWPEFVPYSRKAFPGVNLGFIVKPGFKLGKPPIFNHSDTWNLAMWSGSKNRQATTDFLTFCKARDVQRAMLTLNPGMSPRKDISFDPKESFWINGPGAYMAPVLDAITKGQYRYYGPFGNQDTLFGDIMWPVMNDLFQKKYVVKQALEVMDAKLNEEMATYRMKYPDMDPVRIHWDGIPADLMQGIPVKSIG